MRCPGGACEKDAQMEAEATNALLERVLLFEQVKKVLKMEAEATNGEISNLKAELDRRQLQLDEGMVREEGAQEQLQVF
jgi:hypothetical protein